MTELKPCPFAKPGEVHHTRTIASVGESWVLCSCGASGPTFSGVDSERKAIEAWNTRAERTCHLERIPYEPGEYEGMRCSVCKTVDLEMGVGPYCPGCGAKVVE